MHIKGAQCAGLIFVCSIDDYSNQIKTSATNHAIYIPRTHLLFSCTTSPHLTFTHYLPWFYLLACLNNIFLIHYWILDYRKGEKEILKSKQSYSTQGIILPSEAIDCQRKSPGLGVGYELSVRKGPSEPPNNGGFVISLCHPLKLESKNLLLKTPCSLVTGERKIKLVMTWKLPQ